jgi:DNA-binding transcriptional regulator YdaS (Cro superfamily)
MTPREGLNFAVSLFGSESKLAAAIGYSQDAMNRACKLGKPTAEMAKNIEIVTKRKVTLKTLRPDLFGNGKELVKHSWSRGHRRSRRRRW